MPGSADAVTHIDYDAVGNVTKVTQPDGIYLAYVYDDARRLVEIADNFGNAIDYCPGGAGSAQCLDAAGNRRVEQFKDPSGAVKRALAREYNRLAQLVRTTNAAGLPVAQSQGLSEAGVADGYDRNGNQVLVQDGLGITTKQSYDGLNRLVATIQDYSGLDPVTRDTTTRYEYDARDNLRKVIDPDSLETTYDYDGLNDLVGLHSPDTGTSTYTYDAAGNRITQTDARGVTSTYTYDALNRLTAITYPTSALNVSFSYDQGDQLTGCTGSFPAGRLTRITDASGSTTYCYDRRGNVTRKTQVTAAQTQVVSYTWTKADRLASITYPSGGVATYGRNAIGQITSIVWKGGILELPVTLVSNASYYPFGPLNVLTWGNGRSLSKTYDADYAIDSVASSDPNGLVLDFTADVMGNITEARNALAATTPTRKYQYDRLSRLTQVSDGANVMQEAFAYTRTGDRTRKTLIGQSPQVYSYLAGTHRLSAIDGSSRDHDENGNLVLDEATDHAFVYDDRNRLAAANASPTSAEYGYNGGGERVHKLASTQNFDLRETRTLYGESGRPLSEHGKSICPPLLRAPCNIIPNSVVTEWIYLDDLPIAQVANQQISYLETDHLGTPRLAANSVTNAMQWQWSFFGSAFGDHEPKQASSGAIDVRLRYPGQQYDPETGLHYNYFRDYEPGTGRYVESDPIGLYGAISTYAYVGSSPFTDVDIQGLKSQARKPVITCGLFGWFGKKAGKSAAEHMLCEMDDSQCEAKCACKNRVRIALCAAQIRCLENSRHRQNLCIEECAAGPYKWDPDDEKPDFGEPERG